MRIPDNTIYTSRIRTYGTQGLVMEDVEEEAGCPKLYKAKYVDFALKEPDSPATAYGSLIHDTLFLAEEHQFPLLPDALDKAWERSRDLNLDYSMYEEAVRDLTVYMDRADDGLATIAVEQHLTMPLLTIDGEEYLAGGYIDRLDIDPNDNGTIYVRDYKTNRVPPSQQALDRDNQFTLYLLLVRANIATYLPDVDPDTIRYVGIMDAIKWYDLRTVREPWQLDQFQDWLRAVVRRIVADEEGLPILNPRCSWCPIKFDCSEFRKLPGAGATVADRMSTTTDLTQRVYLMQQAQNTLKALTAAVGDVKDELLEVATAQGPVVFNGVEYAADDQWATDLDLPALHALLGDRFYSVASVTAKALDPYLKQDPELKARVEGVKTRYPKGKKTLRAKKAEAAADDG